MLMQLSILIVLMFVAMLLSVAFLGASKKYGWHSSSMSSFECGFSSYFYSRFSFSIHYFLVGLIFLFLDLELCLLMPFLSELLESSQSLFALTMLMLILLGGLLIEWANKKLDWNF